MPPCQPLRVALFSTLYPSSARPSHGLFVETRLRQLLESGEVEVRVVAPVPWFPSANPRFGARARMAATPRLEVRNGIDVRHPRYPLLPAIGQNLAPLGLALGAYGALRRLQREGFDFDLVDAHYFYPDGVAAALLGKWLGKPIVITARGSDLNVLGGYPLARRMMRWAAGRAAASIGVSRALVNVLRGWGVDPTRLHVMRNGVDLRRFHPIDRTAARERLGIRGTPIMLCVGNLVEVKGHALAIDALALLSRRYPKSELWLVGDGPLRAILSAQAGELGLGERVRFVGTVDNALLADWYAAADVLLLPSRSEGWANVLLEAMACGTPVVATDVGGSAELITTSVAGALVKDREPARFADTIASVLSGNLDRDAVRRYAECFSWDATTQAQLQLFRRIVVESNGEGRRAADRRVAPTE